MYENKIYDFQWNLVFISFLNIIQKIMILNFFMLYKLTTKGRTFERVLKKKTTNHMLDC